MTKTLRITIWEREFTLPIEYESYTGERTTKEQKTAVKIFASHQDWINDSKHVVEEFCKEMVLADDENQKKDNVFSYVKPDYLFVRRDKEYPRVALMCKYRYDPEHGLAIVFAHDGSISVGMQDIIL